MMRKIESPSTHIQSENTAQAANNYHLAYADTLSIHSFTAIRAISQNNRNPSLVSELSKGLGDTAISKFADSEINTISIDTPATEEQKTIAKLPTIVNPQNRNSINQNHTKEIRPSSSSQTSEINTPIRPDTIHSTSVAALTELNTNNQSIEYQNIDPEKYKTKQCIEYQDIALEGTETVVHQPIKRTPSTEIDLGAVLANRYEIIEKIAEGGYGVVYKARQIGIDRIVAIKRLKTKHDKLANQRFLLEANIIKNLIHPNTVQLIDAGIDKNHPYIAMEYIDGISLKELIKQERLTTMRIINITKQILKSLNEAHQRGVVHRDIKPSNILIRQIIGEKDFVKVLDFGIAKSNFSNTPRLTQDGKILGTPQYIAPELFFGDTPTPAVDVFATGLILAEMLTGVPIMPKSTSDVFMIATSNTPIAIPKNAIQSELGDILQCALNKNPQKRYHNAGEMLVDIQRVELKCRLNQSNFNEPYADNKKKFQSNTYLIAIAATLFLIANIFVILHIFA